MLWLVYFCIKQTQFLHHIVKLQTPYLSALDFWNSLVWHFEFDEPTSSLNWIFTACVAWKNPHCKYIQWNDSGMTADWSVFPFVPHKENYINPLSFLFHSTVCICSAAKTREKNPVPQTWYIFQTRECGKSSTDR